MSQNLPKRFNLPFHRDVFWATVFTFAALFLLKLIFFNTHYLDPISRAIEDFQFTDLYYSKLQPDGGALNQDIVLVNIGDNDRAEIAEQLEIIASFNPRILGLDVTFSELKKPYDDSLLKKALGRYSHLVITENIEYNQKNQSPQIIASHPYFDVEKQSGFGNFLAEENKVVRFFSPFYKKGTSEERKSFTVSVVEKAYPEAYNALLERNKTAEVIHYGRQHFITFDKDDIRQDNPALAVLKDKVVLVGYMGDYLGEVNFEDLHLTPLNSSFGGHSIPDMYGVEIHANILSMIIQGKYINSLPQWLVLILSFVITLLHMYLFLYFYVKKHIWFHLVAKVAQLISFGIIVMLSLFAYHYLHWKAEPSYLLVAVALSVDMLYFYDGLVRWLHQKFGYDTYFNQGHH